MPAVTQSEINLLERPAVMTCADPVQDGPNCQEAAEWVALGGHSYALTPVPRCLAHALAARQSGSYIRPISPAEFAAGKLAG